MSQKGPLEDEHYLAFKLNYGHIWGKITRIINQYKDVMVKYKLKSIKVDIKKLIYKLGNLTKVREYDMVDSLLNTNISEDIKFKRLKKGNMTNEEAASVIGSFFVMLFKRQKYKKMIEEKNRITLLKGIFLISRPD
jgi:hypothetical protein